MPIKHCERCGESFTAKTSKTKYCAGCRKNTRNSYMREYTKENYKAPKKRVPRLAIKTIRQVVRELEDYNAKNNTSLTYGQYVAMMEGK